MSAELQTRAKDFLARPVPATMNYVPDSIAERFIRVYAQEGQLSEDGEAMELLGLAAMESSAMADQSKDQQVAEYLRASSALLESMLAERI